MDAEEEINNKIQEVLKKIKEKKLLSTWRDLHIDYGPTTEDEKSLLLKLEDLGTIKLINLTYDDLTRTIKISGDIAQLDGIKLDIIQPNFDNLYEKSKNLSNSYKIPTKIIKSGSRDEIENIIKIKGIRGMQKKLLHTLSDFKPHDLNELKEKVKSKNIIGIKFELKGKLKKTDIDILETKGRGWGKSTYQLKKSNQ